MRVAVASGHAGPLKRNADGSRSKRHRAATECGMHKREQAMITPVLGIAGNGLINLNAAITLALD